MHAIIIGATGATGSDLLRLLLDDKNFTCVDVYVRRPLNIIHEKLRVHVIDFNETTHWQQTLKGDVLFSCLGTTLKAAGSKTAQWKVDYEHQLTIAKAAAENKVSQMVLVSAVFASPSSMFFYSRMKGELEKAVKELGFSKLHIFRPPFLVRKNTDRLGEKLVYRFFRPLNRIGMMQSQRPLPTEVLARSMANVSKRKENGFFIYEGVDIWREANEKRMNNA